MRVIKSFNDYKQDKAQKAEQDKPQRKSGVEEPHRVKDEKIQKPAGKVVTIPSWETY